MTGRETGRKTKSCGLWVLVVVGPLSWRSAIGLPPKPSAHQRRVPEQEAEMLVVLLVVVMVVVMVVVLV